MNVPLILESGVDAGDPLSRADGLIEQAAALLNQLDQACRPSS